jgi:hypothetical protein
MMCSPRPLTFGQSPWKVTCWPSRNFYLREFSWQLQQVLFLSRVILNSCASIQILILTYVLLYHWFVARRGSHGYSIHSQYTSCIFNTQLVVECVPISKQRWQQANALPWFYHIKFVKLCIKNTRSILTVYWISMASTSCYKPMIQ